MKVACPVCGQTLPVENVALDTGWGKCSGCNEVFPLTGLLPGYAAAGVAAPLGHVERPFDAWALVTREPDRLVVHVPAEGMRAATWGMLGFATFWLAFIAFWTAGALGVFFNGGAIQWQNGLFAAFSTPFWLIGFGLLGSILWQSRGTRTLYLDRSQAMTELRCLQWRRRRVLERAQVQHARASEYRPPTRNSNDAAPPLPAVELIFEKGSFRLPCNSPAEQAWMLAEINGFLQNVPGELQPGALPAGLRVDAR